MKRRMAVSILATLCFLPAAACSKSPTSANTSFGAPQASTPANGASIAFASQPVTLTANSNMLYPRTCCSASRSQAMAGAGHMASAGMVYHR